MAAVPPVATPSLKPTRKWIAASIVGVLAIATTAIATGAWDTEEWAALIALGSAQVSAWLIPNDPTPGGVPE